MSEYTSKDYLHRDLKEGDYVVFMSQHYRRLRLAHIYAITSTGKVRLRFGDKDWQTLLQTGDQVVKVDGPDLTAFLLQQKD